MSSASQNNHLRDGILLKCPQKALNPFKHKWQPRWFLLHGNSEQGRVRLEYYDTEKACHQEKGKRVIPLSNCVSIKPVWNKEYNHVIEIVIQDKTIHLAASSKEEEKSWFKDLCKAVFGHANRNSIVQVVDKPFSDLDFGYHSLDRTSLEGSSDSPRTLHTVEEQIHEEQDSREEVASIDTIAATINDNTSVDGSHGSSERLQRSKTLTSSVASELSSLVSFESGFDDGSSVVSTMTEASSFPVTVRPTIASQNANMNGTYLLQVNHLSIVLIDVPTQKPICEWPIQYLRRYGRGRTKFSFEASDKCKYGKGVYTFNTLEGDSIFHLVDTHARGISMRNQMLRKRTSMPDGFKPLGNTTKRLHHSEGKLLDKFSTDITPNPQENTRFSDSVNDVNDILSIGPGDSVSQIGTLRGNPLNTSSGQNKRDSLGDDEDKERRRSGRGASIGSGISVEIAQNISSGDELKTLDEPTKHDSFEGVYENVQNEQRTLNLKPVSPIQEETFTQFETEKPSSVNKPLKNVVTVSTSGNKNDIQNKTGGDETNNTNSANSNSSNKKHKSGNVKRSSSLKLPSALKRSNSAKDSSIKKSSSVKRSSSFRSRFFKSKNSPDEEKSKVDKTEKITSKSAQDLSSTTQNKSNSSSVTIDELDHQIAQELKAKEILAKAIEDDMNRNSEAELLNIDATEKHEKKRRKLPVRHKSNEMLENGAPRKPKIVPNRLSSSFTGYDYKGHAVLARTGSYEKDSDDEEIRRLHRRTQSVMKKVELYESMKRQAEEVRVNSYTMWRKRQSNSSPKNKDINEIS